MLSDEVDPTWKRTAIIARFWDFGPSEIVRVQPSRRGLIKNTLLSLESFRLISLESLLFRVAKKKTKKVRMGDRSRG